MEEDRGLVVDVEPTNIANIGTIPSSMAPLDTVMVNGTVYTLTSPIDITQSGLTQGEKLDSLDDKNDVATSISNLDSQCIEVDTARGLVCMKVGDTVYQMPLCGISASADNTVNNQLLSTPDSIITTQGNNFLELSIADPVDDTGQTLTDPAVPVLETKVESLLPTTLDLAKITPSSSTEETTKRKGGWPKGKRRKPEIKDKNAPKAPTTGYVLYAMERRKKIEKQYPSLFFPEITKILGNEWSEMVPHKKQKYLDAAEADKKRYIEELKAYQQSEAYQSFVKKKKMTGLANSLDSTGTGNTVIEMDDDSVLCCKVCDKYFSSLHNKKEHMLGRQHLQAIKGEYELELHKQSVQKMPESLLGSASDLHIESSPLASCSDESKHETGHVDLDSFIQEFMERNMERELEIRELKASLQKAREKNLEYGKQITEMKGLDTKLEQDLATMKAYGISLTAQIDMLKMVPTLFGVINF